MSQKPYWLLNNVVSHFAPYRIYGKAGTEVKILQDHLDMMIVQDLAGNTFHSRTDNLSETESGLTPSVNEIKIVTEKQQSRRQQKKNSAPITQTNLFK